MEKIKILNISILQDICNIFKIDDYVLQLKIQGLAFESQKYYIKYLKNFIEYSKFEKIDDFNNIIKLRFAYYNLTNKGINNNTIGKYYKCIRKYYKFLKEIELSEKILIDELQKVKGTKSLPKSLSEDDIIKIKECLKHKNRKFNDIRDYVIFETFINTGIRRAELLNLKLSDISMDYFKIIKGKGNKDRLVYISKKFSKLITDYIKLLKEKGYGENDSLFGLTSVEGISLIIRKISRLSKIPFSPHLLRHTYASLCVRKGINLYTIQQQLGHTDLKTTSVYLYLNNKENWEEIQKFIL